MRVEQSMLAKREEVRMSLGMEVAENVSRFFVFSFRESRVSI